MQMYKNNLSSDELQHFYQYGYVIIKNLYSRNQISVLCGIWIVDDADLDNGRLWVVTNWIYGNMYYLIPNKEFR